MMWNSFVNIVGWADRTYPFRLSHNLIRNALRRQWQSQPIPSDKGENCREMNLQPRWPSMRKVTACTWVACGKATAHTYTTTHNHVAGPSGTVILLPATFASPWATRGNYRLQGRLADGSLGFAFCCVGEQSSIKRHINSEGNGGNPMLPDVGCIEADLCNWRLSSQLISKILLRFPCFFERFEPCFHFSLQDCKILRGTKMLRLFGPCFLTL